MKRVLALTLVAVLAIGMSIGAFAFDGNNIKGFADGKTLADGVTLPKGAGWTGGQALDLGIRYAMDEFTMGVDLRADMFGGGQVAEKQTLYYTLDADKFMSSDALFTVRQDGPAPGSWTDVKNVLEAATSTQLKPGVDIADYIQPNTTNDQAYTDLLTNYQIAGLVKKITSKNLSGVIYFTDKTGAVMSTEENLLVGRNLSADEIRRSKITMGTTMKANSNAIKEIKLDNRNGRIDFKLVTEWVSTGNKDFEAVIYLLFGGKRADAQGLTILGNMRNPELEVYKDHDHVDLSKGYVAVPMEFNSKIAVYVGNGATVHTKMFKDKKYYCITTRDDDQEATQVFKQYKDVDNVLTFKNVGLNNSSDYVTLSTDYADYWVYDKDMNYLGRGNEQLAFSQKYYLSNKKLDIVDEDDEDDLPVEDDEPNVGGDGSSNNVNANPGTGR